MKQQENDTFIYQTKCTCDLIEMFDMKIFKSSNALISPTIKLNIDESGKFIDQKFYKKMIGSFLYLVVA